MTIENIKLSEYLFTRLRQLGVGAIHGVPGDYNLTLLDYVEPSGLTWVGNCNELNAGYAADGYARIKGIGALITTFGVGELSAINAIAGAYAERAAVVHIVGTPNRAAQESRALIHHTLNDGEYTRFQDMSRHVTVSQIALEDPRMCPQQIDEVLRLCILHSRPVYIAIPVDMVDTPVSAVGLDSSIQIPVALATSSHYDVVDNILERLYAAKQPAILVDGECRALGIVNEVQTFVATSELPTWTTTFAKSLINETLTNTHGIYRGDYDDPHVKSFWQKVDLVLCFGPHFSSTNSYAWTSVPNSANTIAFHENYIRIGSKVFRDLPAKLALSLLLEKIDMTKVAQYEIYPDLPRDKLLSFSDVPSNASITQNNLWKLLGNLIQPGDIILGETGTAGYGVRDVPLPYPTRLFTPVTWLSIGYMLPASQGASLAQRELIAANTYHNIASARTILFIGDGSFQMTAQELSTIVRLRLDVIIFLINNDGYTIERCIHGLKQTYNDVAPWRYLQAPSFFGAGEEVYTARAKTWGELNTVLGNENLLKGSGLKMVEVLVEKEDAPQGILAKMLETQQAIEKAKN